MTTLRKVNEIYKDSKYGEFKLKADEDFIKKFKQGDVRQQTSTNNFLIYLKLVDGEVIINKVYIKDFVSKIFDIVEPFVFSDDKGQLIYPDDFNQVIKEIMKKI